MSSPAAGAATKSLIAFGKKERKMLFDPMLDNNPITVQVLGVCSALAVTVQVNRAIVMALALISVLVFSNVIISMLRKLIPPSIRIIIMLAVIASLVIIVDQVLQAFLFDISKSLSVFVGLIITNCILLGRAEAFALANPPWQSFLDGVGNGMGYGIILVVVAALREILGSGTFLGFHVVPQIAYDLGYMNMGLMVLAPGAFILLGLLVWVQRTVTGYRE
ncbi:MAG: NADH:ubiquinone reductase (Na(+)-transporting) subunit D [Deltaproteobacteria bacterium]|nr:NADH:ubiquinone reductase (Na(+)-transporting) subunit D [Deltaproteobacteria bacterium]